MISDDSIDKEKKYMLKVCMRHKCKKLRVILEIHEFFSQS